MAKRKELIYAKRSAVSARSELKPLVYLATIGVPFLLIMWTLRKEK